MKREDRGSISSAARLLGEMVETPVSEIVFRGVYAVSSRIHGILGGAGAGTESFPAHPDLIRQVCDHIRVRKQPQFFLSPKDVDDYRSCLLSRFRESSLASVTDAADEIAAHHFRVLGLDVEYGPEVDWHLAIDTGRHWPRTNWRRIDTRSLNSAGDVKYVWELNRHQHFFTLGRAYWWSGDERYAAEFMRQAKHWLRENPGGLGVNWASGLEIALRAISWLWAMTFFLRSPHLEDDFLRDAICMLAYSGRRLEVGITYSRHCLRNNHLIGEAAGLAMIAIFFPEFGQSSRWLKKGLDVLLREIHAQVHPDGVSKEQSVGYHRFVLYLYILVVRLIQTNEIVEGGVPSTLLSTIEKMVEFIQAIKKPDGTVPMLGDCDDGQAVNLGPEPPNDYTPVLSTGAVLFHRGDFKYSAGRLSEETIWLMGLNAPRVFDGIELREPGGRITAFPDSGQYVIRSDWSALGSSVLFRCGPHGMHGHSDQVAVIVANKGEDVLVDTGTFTYNGSRKWRDHFRGTSSHNTVIVDQEPQSIPVRTFKWIRKAMPLKGGFGDYGPVVWVSGGHTGYRRLKDPVTHNRDIVVWEDKYVFIVDNLSAKGGHQYELIFNLAPGRVRTCESGCFEMVNRRACVQTTLFALLKNEINACLYEGLEYPEVRGWVSGAYGKKEPAPSIVYYKRATGHARFVTLVDLTGTLSEGRITPIGVHTGDCAEPIPDCAWEIGIGAVGTITIALPPPAATCPWAAIPTRGAPVTTDGGLLVFKMESGRACYAFSPCATLISSNSFSVTGARSHALEWPSPSAVLTAE